jgi:hypothetical protein
MDGEVKMALATSFWHTMLRRSTQSECLRRPVDIHRRCRITGTGQRGDFVSAGTGLQYATSTGYGHCSSRWHDPARNAVG